MQIDRYYFGREKLERCEAAEVRCHNVATQIIIRFYVFAGKYNEIIPIDIKKEIIPTPFKPLLCYFMLFLK